MKNILRVKLPINKLLEILKENRDKHQNNYNEALEKFKVKSAIALLDRVEDIRSGKIENYNKIFSFDIPIPVSYVSEYDEIIRMLELSNQEEVEVDSEQFKCWAEDKWDWSWNFGVNTLSYNKR